MGYTRMHTNRGVLLQRSPPHWALLHWRQMVNAMLTSLYAELVLRQPGWWECCRIGLLVLSKYVYTNGGTNLNANVGTGRAVW